MLSWFGAEVELLMMPATLDSATVSHFARLALAHVTREYPNKLDHVMLSADDVRSPAVLHPVFYGSFDWHSCVHGYWLLATLYRLCPDMVESREIEAVFERQFVGSRMAVEVAYASHMQRGGFERPYGWAWVLMLAAELLRHENELGRRCSAVLEPLAAVFVERFLTYLPRATYPVRVGTHFNTAFAVRLMLEYGNCVARHGDGRVAHSERVKRLDGLARATASRWYMGDRDCQAWEPGGDDFLSSALMEAECMRVVLGPERFEGWFSAFLPRLDKREPLTLFVPATVSDRSDGKIAHLDGLNLSRAWCWRSVAAVLPEGDVRKALGSEAAREHLKASLPWVAGDYMGEHWLASFALLALREVGEG